MIPNENSHTDELLETVSKFDNFINLSRFQKNYEIIFGIVEIPVKNDVKKPIPPIDFKIGIDADSKWELYYQERLIPKENNLLSRLPEKVDTRGKNLNPH